MTGIQAPSLPVLGSSSAQGNVYVDQYLSGLYFSGFLSMLSPLDSGLCSQKASSLADSCFLTSCDSACLFLITSIFKITFLGKEWIQSLFHLDQNQNLGFNKKICLKTYSSVSHLQN